MQLAGAELPAARSPGHLARVTVRPVRGARCNLHEDGRRKLGLLASELGVDALRDHMRAWRKRQDFSARTRGGRVRRSKRSVTVSRCHEFAHLVGTVGSATSTCAALPTGAQASVKASTAPQWRPE